MIKILVQKNNKVRHKLHLYEMYNFQGDMRGLLLRIEATSYRQNCGSNRWDIFFSSNSATEVVENGKGTEISRYNGRGRSVVENTDTPTVLGNEIIEESLTIKGIPFSEMDTFQRKFCASCILLILSEGFGPHGDINNAGELKKWAEEIQALAKEEEEMRKVEIEENKRKEWAEWQKGETIQET